VKNEKQGGGLGLVVAFFMGGLVGAVLSLLFAPFAGRETRERIREVSTGAKELTVDAVHTAKGRATELVNQGKERIHETKGGMKAAVEAGQKAFVQKKVELTDEAVHEDEDSSETDGETAS
jgi:gas vesicle protein